MRYPLKHLFYSITLVVIGMLLHSCHVDKPVKPNLILASEDIPQLILTQTDYDSVQISFVKPIHLSEQLITHFTVEITKSSGVFLLSDTLQPVYRKLSDGWKIDLEKTYGVSDSVTAIDVQIKIAQRYDGAITRTASLQCLNYPYPSAKIIFSFKDINNLGHHGVQDLAVGNQQVYLFGFGADGAWDYDHANGNLKYLFVTGFGGDYMTVNDTALFCNFGEYEVGRYSFRKQKFYFHNDLSDSLRAHIDDIGIQGITKAGSLLVVLASTSGFHQTIFWITPDLQLRGWQNIDPRFRTGNGIAYVDSILFTVQGFDNPVITRYSMSQEMMLPALMVPSRGIWGIDIVGDWLYFIDNAKMIVGVVPLGTLKPLPQ